MKKIRSSRPGQGRRALPRPEVMESRLLLSASHAGDVLKPHLALTAEVSAAAVAHAVKAHAKPKGLILSATAEDATTVVLHSSKNLGAASHRVKSFKVNGLPIVAAKPGPERNSVILTTAPQANAAYTIRVTTSAGIRKVKFTGATPPSLAAPVVAPAAPPPLPTIIDPVAPTSPDAPRVVGAVSTSNNTVVVQFSEKMSDSVLNPANYTIVQANVNPEAGGLRVLSIPAPAFLVRNGVVDRSSVILTTTSQNELTYTVLVANVLDTTGTPLQARSITSGVVIDPTSASFAGSPPTGTTLVDSDGDGLSDNEELRGYVVTIKLLNGKELSRGVTSDPYKADTDGDGLSDYTEAQLRLDPRSADTDSDTLSDYQEFNEIFSDPLNQDTDGDSLDDGSEFTFFHTSPVFDDTDGDQIKDGDEIVGNRNPLVADVPQPRLSIGGINLQVDLRYSATSSRGTRDLTTKSISTELAQGQSTGHETSSSTAFELHTDFTTGSESGDGGRGIGFVDFNVGASLNFNSSVSDSSAQESSQTYDKSLSTDAETTSDESVQRDVLGARIQVALGLKSVDTLAYRVKNLQVTAFTQDPQNPTHLTPLATLLPDSEPDDGYALGPLVGERGPIILSSDTVFPKLVDDLMANPHGLVFRISNYDIVDESGRNFAFTSQSIAERTGALVIDYGGSDDNGDGKPDGVEVNRVAVNAGRQAVDTNGDLLIDANDRPVVFDGNGKPVGITLRQGLSEIGLNHYEAQFNSAGKLTGYLADDLTLHPTLTARELHDSYATATSNGVTRLYRVRDVTEDGTNRKFWEIVSYNSEGLAQILHDVNLDTQVISPDANFALSLVQDLDGDGIGADVEFILGTSDTMKDSDGDGLDDHFEVFVGWDVDLGAQGRRHVYSSPTLTDSDRDGISDYEEAPRQLLDAAGNPLTMLTIAGNPYSRAQILGLEDTDHDGKVDTAVTSYYVPVLGNLIGRYAYNPNDPSIPLIGKAIPGVAVSGYYSSFPAETLITDPRNRDTDGDGLDDKTESDGFDETLLNGTKIHIVTSPNKADTDGDTAPDGLEVRLGGNPTDASDKDSFADDDRDGLINIIERQGWEIITHSVSTTSFVQQAAWHLFVKSDPNNPDSDGDGVPDGEEYARHTVPGTYIDYLYSGPETPVQGHKDDPYVAGKFNNHDPATGIAYTDAGRYPTRVAVASPGDTDLDGLTDFQEIRGFQLRDLGIIATDPTDADTDDDKRSDGVEAELKDTLAGRWVVSVQGQTPYRVYSDPLLADADFDGLGDGDEFLAGADPTKADTDGDGRSDLKEVQAGLQANVKDHMVTVGFYSIYFDKNGDSQDRKVDGTGLGEIEIGLGVRTPDRSGNQIDGMKPVNPASGGTYFVRYGADFNGDRFADTQYLLGRVGYSSYFGDVNNQDFRDAPPRTLRFGMTETERFSVLGYMNEWDFNSNNTRYDNGPDVVLGGYAGTPVTDVDGTGKTRGAIFNWDDIKGSSIHKYSFVFDAGSGDDEIKGNIVFYVYVD